MADRPLDKPMSKEPTEEPPAGIAISGPVKNGAVPKTAIRITPKKATQPSKARTTGKKPANKGRQAEAPLKKEKIERPYPRTSLEEALKVPVALKEKNGGNPWTPDQVAKATGLSAMSSAFFYMAGAAREYGLTTGGRDSKEIALTPLGRDLVFAGNPIEEARLKMSAFLKVEVFKKVLDHYGGSNLPEMQYLSNTLQKEYGLHPSTHEEFSKLFKENCDFLKIGARFSGGPGSALSFSATDEIAGSSNDLITVAEAEHASALTCFVAMPFGERTELFRIGHFQEVLRALIAPAGRKAGFNVRTSRRQGTDVIQSTIIQSLMDADLVIVDLTEHNPNVLLELGIRLAKEKPVALIRAEGTAPIFDVDNMLRVFDYKPNLWPSTLEGDVPKLAEHIKATWEQRTSSKSYMQTLLSQ
jgi:hypothetical protein